MEGLLGDGDDDVSRRDVSPRDVSLCRAVARSRAASLLQQPGRARLQQKQKQEATGDLQLDSCCYLLDTFYSVLMFSYCLNMI